MNSHFLKYFFRTIKSNRLLYGINFFGLIIAFTSIITILTFIINETSFNKNFENSENIYRIIANHNMFGETYSSTRTMDDFASELKSEYPEVEKSSRVFNFTYYFGDAFFGTANEYYKEESFILVDNDFWDIFPTQIVSGKIIDFYKNPNAVILTDKTAKRFFGTANPIGKTITLKYRNNTSHLTVSAIIDKYPSSSTIEAEIIGKISSSYPGLDSEEMIANYQTYILLNDNTLAEILENKIPVQGDDDFSMKYRLQNIRDAYLHSSLFEDSPPDKTGSLRNIYIFSLISILILSVACGNYIILSSISFISRSKEVAIKKTNGMSRKSLFISLLGESIALSVLTMPLAVLCSVFALSALENIFKITLSTKIFLDWQFLLCLFIILLFTGVLSGSYNAFYLSSLKPVKLFNQDFIPGSKRSFFRKGIVIFQTITFIVLSFSIVIIYQQTKYGLHKDIGYDKAELITIDCSNKNFSNNYIALKESVQENPAIANVSACSNGLFTSPLIVLQKNERSNDGLTGFHVYPVDYSYIETVGFKLIQGRTFSNNFHPEKNNIIINETAVKEYGFDNPIGKTIEGKKVIGVIKDFNVSSIKENIPPIMFQYMGDNEVNQIVIKSSDIKLASDILLKQVQKLSSQKQFEITYIDDKVKLLYQDESRFMQLVNIFTLLTIIISSMGLFGLSAFVINQKLKEIAIRKTFGANYKKIIAFLFSDYVRMILVSNLIGLPIAYTLMRKWLIQYAFHINIKPVIFLFVILLSSLIILLTVGFNIFKVSKKNLIIHLNRNQ
jgi:putative ABC transport system permease protein